jgi:hypothetical protein
MTAPPQRPATDDGLMLWIMHRFGEVFAQHAILKGGMALRLFDCPRSTTEIDYVLIPFASKKDVRADVERTLRELEDAKVEVELNSKVLRATVELDQACVQVEVSVSKLCPSEPMATAAFAAEQGQPSSVVRVMRPSLALAHTLAAWNERRLYRDLFDVYYLRTRIGAKPDRATLEERLERIDSRIPELSKTKSMTVGQFAGELRTAAERLDATALHAELQPLLPERELAGLAPRLRSALIGVFEELESDSGL